jgi:chromosome segregation protein
VAPDLPTLLGGWQDLPPGWCAVTAAGDLADERGLVVVRGRQDDAAGEAARQHARRRELAQLLATLEQEQAEAGEAAARTLVAASQARRARDEAAEARSLTEGAASRARATHERATALLERAREHERALAAELEMVRRETAPASTPESAEGADLAELTARAIAARGSREELAAERDRRRAAWQSAQAAADATDSGQGGARYERALLVARRDQLAAGVSRDRGSLAPLEAERVASSAAVAAAAAAVEAASGEREAADAERDRLRADLLEGERRRGGGASRLAELERDAQAAALEAQRQEDELVAVGRERDLALESLPTLEEELPGEPEAGSAELVEAGPEAIADELGRVRRTLSQIGSVNPFAIDEHRDLAGRLETLVAQDADLSAAASSTEELIARLDAEIAEQFNAAFVAIGARFEEFCRLLFAGGSASLQMSDGGGEEAGGIEIAVQPPGKRLQRLAMLSGGERSLAGVALLFAMLSVNPVPFCILDEVDAALDEANIGRFADALRLLAQTIDFVVITHNRATIETADTIYGVTMTDAAVSRLLSLRLADIPVEVAAG